VAPLSVTTKKAVVENIIDNLVSITSYKGDITNIQELRISIEGVRKELQNLAKEMYVEVQEFQKKASQILTQLYKTKTKNMEFVGIRVGLDEMNKWV
jgi:predicted ArsR family transcriptional regulator